VPLDCSSLPFEECVLQRPSVDYQSTDIQDAVTAPLLV